jgi:chitin disaccharide deacetylase
MAHHETVVPVLNALGFPPENKVVVLHADDLGMCHGANLAFAELSERGTLTCGAVMAPCPWFTEVADMAIADPHLDLGVHLTLTSEWATYRWAPLSTTSRSSGLIDERGYFWRRVPMLAAHVVPEAAETEMRAQIDRALAAGIDATHLDAHMGAALLPSLVEIYIRLGREYRLPVLFPRAFQEYASVLEFAGIPLEGYEVHLRSLEKEGWPLVDHFRMTPGVPSAESDRTYRDLVAAVPSGLTMIALHPNKGGDIETIVPAKAHYRTDEYRILGDPAFRDFLANQQIRTVGFRPLRQMLRQRIPGQPSSTQPQFAN